MERVTRMVLRTLLAWLLLCGVSSAQGVAPVLNNIDITRAPYKVTANTSANWSATNAANTTGLAAAITDAQSAGVPLYIPAPKTAGACYNYTAPLTITANLKIIGDFAKGNWKNNINIPGGSPPLIGSILCPTSNGSDAIDITDSVTLSLNVEFSDIGILFQTLWTRTGDGIHYIPTTGATSQGLSGSHWTNVPIYGHDGDHYCVNLDNFIYDQFDNVTCYGGGGFLLTGNGNVGNYGNSVFNKPFAMVVAGGAAHGYSISATRNAGLSLLVFNGAQSLINAQSELVPAPSSLPTSAQSPWVVNPNVVAISTPGLDLAVSPGIVSGSFVTMGGAAQQLDWQWGSLLQNVAAVSAPAWGLNGFPGLGNRTQHFNDSTTSGTIAAETPYAFPGGQITCSVACAITDLATLYIGNTSAGTNVTATRIHGLYMTSEIYTTSDIVATGGAFITGASSINFNGSGTSAVGGGTNGGLTQVGNNNNLTRLGGATLATNATTGFPMIPAMAGTPTGTVAVVSGMAAMVIDTTNQKLCYSTGGGTWECSAAFTP